MSGHTLLSRRWIVRHSLALVVVCTCVAMALWQVSRLQDRRAANRHLVAQAGLPESRLDQVLASPDPAYRRVRARGSFDAGREVILRSRSFEGRPGNHLLTPLRTEGGAIVVDRGWVPIEVSDPADPRALPPQGEVEVTGVLLPDEERGLFGVSDPPPGAVTALSRIDLERIREQLPYPVPPFYLRLQEQTPAGAALPEPVPIPPPDEGPHLDYAVQWCFFALASSAAYLALVRKEARREGGGRRKQPAEAGPSG